MTEIDKKNGNGSMLLLLLFGALFFLLNAYDLFFLLDPVRGYGLGKEPTIDGYIVANFLPRLIYHLVKFVAIAFLLKAGFLILHLTDKFEPTFTNFFQFIVKLEFIFLCEKLYKILYLTLINDIYTFEEYLEFSPLSLYNQIYAGYPFVQKILKDLSLFDIIYMGLMVHGLNRYFSATVSKSFSITMLFYFLPLVLINWLLFLIGL